MKEVIPISISSLLGSNLEAARKLSTLVALLRQELNVDRCFLYLRNPEKEKGKIAFCACKDESIPDVTEDAWKPDTGDLPKQDPLFAAALRAEPSIYVEDVLTAPEHVLNKDFEAQTFGHRALVHAHIIHEGKLWGILQPAMFRLPHHWTQPQKELIETLLPLIKPAVVEYVLLAGID